MMKKLKYKSLFLIFALVFIGISQELWSQKTNMKRATISIKAQVKDSLGVPIVNAEVFGNQGAVVANTDKNGFFELQVYANSSILIESVGYNSLIVNTMDRPSEIYLTKNEFLLGNKDILPLAFKYIRKGISTGNVSEINPSEILKYDNVTRFQNLLDSYGAGLKGEYNLLGLGNALVVVDGLARDASNLIPEEIESITILKDVNSTVLYGSKAKNGVIIIKTKRGVSYKRIINMSIEQGINVPITMPKYLNSKNYMILHNEAQTNDNPAKVPDYDPLLIANYDGSNPYRYPDVDYYGTQFLKPLFNSSRFVGEFSGGNNIASYYANVAYEHQGVLYKANNNQNNGSDRLRVRGNVDFAINSHIKSYIDAAFIFNVNTGLRTDYFNMASTYRPNDYTTLLPTVAFEDPTISDPLTHVNGGFILGGNSTTGLNSYGKNLIGETNLAGYSKNYNNNMQFNTGLVYDLEQVTKGLSLRGNISFDTYGSYSESIQNTYALYEPTWNDLTGKISSIKTINSDSKTGVLTLSSGAVARSIGSSILLDYDRVFDKTHHIASSLLGYYSMTTIPEVLQPDKSAHIGLRVAYDYNNCYIVDFSGALINSVKLAPSHRLSFSPSLGLGWVVSKSSFWKKNKIVNYLKIKTSAGILQTDASSSFGYNMFRNVISGFSEFSTNDGNGPTTHSGYFSQTDNPNLEMEKMKNLNVGFETALLDKSLFIDVSYFRTNYTDQITKRSNYYPAFISTYIPYENYNQTSYSGIDASLKYKKKFGDFYIESGINLLYSTSEYIKLDEIHNNNYQYLVGKPTDSYWGLTNLGFFNTDAEAKAANQRFGSIRRGDIHYVDNDGNGFIDDNDKTTIGNWSPRVTGDLNLSVAFKGFCLFVTANMQLGYDWMMSSDYFWIDGNKKYSEMALNRWTDATAETATYPRLSAQTSQNNFRASDFWIVNGNSISLSRVQMNYSMPSKLFNNLFIKGISVYLRGSDLLLLAENARLRQTNSYVSSRNFSLGLKIRY